MNFCSGKTFWRQQNTVTSWISPATAALNLKTAKKTVPRKIRRKPVLLPLRKNSTSNLRSICLLILSVHFLMITKSSCSVEDRNAAQLGLFEFAMWMLAKIVVLLAVHITDLVNDRTYLVDKSTTSVLARELMYLLRDTLVT